VELTLHTLIQERTMLLCKQNSTCDHLSFSQPFSCDCEQDILASWCM